MASYGVIRALFCGILVVFLIGARESDAQCPWACECQRSIVDCSHRGLFQVPKHLPEDAERIDLQGNNITIIFQSDFQYLKKLKSLQLSENQIHTVERDAFSDLVSLERLKLNNNRLVQLPENLFVRLRHLQRLDLSRNELTAVSRRALRGLSNVKNIHLDSNKLRCIDEKALEQLKSLEILTLTNNNLTYVQLEPASIARLRQLRLTDNPIVCDCRVARLVAAVRATLTPILAARCHAPAPLRGALMKDLEPHELICFGPTSVSAVECSAEPRCPVPCRCTPEGTVDCREKMLTVLPQHIPHKATEIRLEQNDITEVGAGAFSSVKRVARIDLSNNKIAKLADDAFSGLTVLTSLVLYGNKIKELPPGIFFGLGSLQLLLLNSNEISCIKKDTFRDLINLKLLSLYDNNIKSLPNGTFDSFTTIQTLHLGRNPFVCDCSLRWLAAYLLRNPIETSGAKCDAPKKWARKRIDTLREENFKCKGDSPPPACGAVPACPAACSCSATGGLVTVSCARVRLADVPRDLPANTYALKMPGNRIGQIKSDGLFGRLPELRTLDLKRNDIVSIEDNAFDGAANIQELLLDDNLLTSLSDKMFLGLHSLTTLSLTNNNITCVAPGAFDHLSMLTHLNLESNPLHCSCHIAWLSGWLRQHANSKATCATPQRYSKANIAALDLGDFICTSSDVGCLSNSYCPAQCSCAGTVVRCSRAGLTDLPTNIPKHTTELYLESNEIKTILPEQISHLTQLTRLDLSNNKISVLLNNTFKGITKLSTLIVSYNQLRCVQRDALKGLTQLRVLSLHGNNISMLHEGVFRDLASISHVALGSNPLYCDCALRWLSRWVRAAEYVEPGSARCAAPERMRDKLVLSTAEQAFACNDERPAEVISKCDRCYINPCQNGGECRSSTDDGYTCICARGYHGENCQYEIDACYGSPCDNGVCNVLEEGRFNCTCHPGFTGSRCEVNIDDCADHHCMNNATCVDQSQGYTCECARGYMGKFCETKISYCTKEFNPCSNGAICTDFTSYYTCTCPKGYTGENCTVNPDDCINHMCQNGARCIDGLEEYTCACPAGLAGRYCEAAPHAVLGTSPCAQHECVHGVCYLPQGVKSEQPSNPLLMGAMPMTSNDYACKCAHGYTGRFCEYLTSLTFNHNNSLVELEPLRTKPDANVTLVFSTTQAHGVLMYIGEEQHLAVELFNGRIRISYDVGNHPTSTMYSFEMVSNGAYHKAELLAVSKNFTLRVDDGPARSIINEGKNEYLRVSKPMYIGGVPESVGKDAYSKWHLRNISSFKGCLKQAWINHKQVDFLNAQRSGGTAPGCGPEEPVAGPAGPEMRDQHVYGHGQVSSSSSAVMSGVLVCVIACVLAASALKLIYDPCVPNPCKRGGRCVREEGSDSDYTCRCRPGTRGAQCELLASIGGAPVITQTRVAKPPPTPASPLGDSAADHADRTCRKVAKREFITERGCRSRRPVRAAACAGGCQRGHCCAPKKTKRRKIRLICSDGNRYTKEIEIVRKCGCGRGKCPNTSPFQ